MTKFFIIIDSCSNRVCDSELGESCGTCFEDCRVCSVSPPSFESLYKFANSSSTIVVNWIPLENVTSNYLYILQMSKQANSGFETVYHYHSHFDLSIICILTIFIYQGAATQFVISNLDSATIYYFQLAAAVSQDNELITGSYSDVVSTKTSGIHS